MGASLFQLTGQWLDVADMMLDPDIDQETIKDTLESIEGEITVKADGYCDVIRKLEMEEASLKAKKEYVNSILKGITSLENNVKKNIEWMKNNLQTAMIATGLDEKGIKTDRFEITIKGVGGQRKLETTDNVPDEFLIKEVVVKIDDKKIREYLKDHEVDWAWLLPGMKKLDIKGV